VENRLHPADTPCAGVTKRLEIRCRLAFQNEISNICSHPTLLRIPSQSQRHSHGRGHDPATGEAVTRCRRLWLLHPSPSSASGPIHGAPCSTAGGLSITIKTSTGPACSLLSPIHSPQWKNPAKDWLEIEGIIKKNSPSRR
jgi:hypothetical protein